MLNITDLERRWLRYKIKRFAPVIATLIVALLLVPVFFILNTNHVEEKKIQTPKPEKPVIPTLSSQSESSMELEPSMQFIETIGMDEEISQSSSKETPSISAAATVRKSLKPSNPTPPKTSIKPALNVNPPPAYSQQSNTLQPLKAPPVENKQTGMVRGNMAFDIRDVEERFASNANPQLGLFIARYYYDHGNYNEAYNYALKTNSLNNNIEESWILFAKSLIKLGKVDQARQTLTLYTSKHNSEEAKILLNSLTKEGQK